jgi:hypothetical protein
MEQYSRRSEHGTRFGGTVAQIQRLERYTDGHGLQGLRDGNPINGRECR